MSKGNGFFTGWLRKTLSQFAQASPDDLPGWMQIFGNYMGSALSSSGERVTADSAMQISAVFSCVKVIAESIAATPIHMYRRNDNGTVEPNPLHPLQFLLHEAANGYQSSFEFKEMMQAHALLRGNAYALKVRSTLAQDNISELVPIFPDRVQCKARTDGTPYYIVSPMPDQPGSPKEFGPDQIFHFKGMSLDGLCGLSPISYHRETLGLALAQAKHGGRLFANGARPGGVLEHPGKIGDKALTHLKESISENYGGANVFKPMVLEEGMKWQTLTMTNLDAQYLEGRKFSRSEIASLYRVPPHKIGDLEKATFSNIEQQAIEFVTDCLLPWVRRWEATIVLQLVDVPKYYFPEFMLDAMMRGDLKSRYDAYAVARNWGWLNVNDIRRKENMNTIGTVGDIYLQPVNMVPAGTPPAPPPDPNTGTGKALDLLRAEIKSMPVPVPVNHVEIHPADVHTQNDVHVPPPPVFLRKTPVRDEHGFIVDVLEAPISEAEYHAEIERGTSRHLNS